MAVTLTESNEGVLNVLHSSQPIPQLDSVPRQRLPTARYQDATGCDYTDYEQVRTHAKWRLCITRRDSRRKPMLPTRTKFDSNAESTVGIMTMAGKRYVIVFISMLWNWSNFFYEHSPEVLVTHTMDSVSKEIAAFRDGDVLVPAAGTSSIQFGVCVCGLYITTRCGLTVLPSTCCY